MAAVLSSCDTINNLAGSEIANVITENVTEQITMRTNADPDAVAAAASSLAAALTIRNNGENPALRFTIPLTHDDAFYAPFK